MKLRIKGNSMRLRLSQSEVTKLAQRGEIEDTIHFAPQPEAKLTYALNVAPPGKALSLQYQSQKITIYLESESVAHWATMENEVGIYGDVENGYGRLAVLIEKDFACLDASGEDNEDTFPNPNECRTSSKEIG